MESNKQLSELNLNELLQKAKDIQNEMKSMQSRLANAYVTGVAGNQDVQIMITGKYNAVSTH